MSSGFPTSTALNWHRSCRLIGPARFRIPLSDAVLTVLFALVVLADFTLMSTWGPHPAYVANTLVALVVTVAQPLRHRSPVISGLIVYLAMVAYVALLRFTPVNLGLSPIIMAVPTALHALTRWAPDRRWGVVALQVALVGAIINPQTVYTVNPHTAHMFNYPPFGFALACVLVVTAVYLWALRSRGDAELLDQIATEAAVRAVAAERLTISRELHDLVGHGLTAVQMQADAGLTLGTPEAFHDSLTTVRDVAAGALASTREMVALLRDSTPQRTMLPIADLAGIPDMVAHARNAGLEVEADLPNAAELAAWNQHWTALQRLALSRIVSEGLANAAKHGTGSVRITVSQHDGHCEVHITNPVADPSPADFSYRSGLSGMAERLRLIDGRLDARPCSETGDSFVLDAVFPADFPTGPTPEEGK
ncbi:sensor histidine kinase [Actinomyces qiguomingii]|uniref:sensor histidine kinase n=1 Tax=Actinomyces qiguomingii TaxID=2057800 RepID=UPI000CA01405|nr:histidine kinase [Actinomyces qiguomingii]